MSWNYIVLSCLIGVVLAQDEFPGFDGSITLPPNLQQKFNETEIENMKGKYLEQFKKKCEKNNHPEVYDQALSAVETVSACFTSLVNMSQLQDEIEEAKPNGKVDEVFKKYCAKSPQFKSCFRNMTETVKPCFAPDEQKNFKTLYNVTDQLAEFICFKEGDRIALFIAEGGKECFEEKQEEVQNCFNQTFSDPQSQSYLQNVTAAEDIFDLEFKEKQCNQMNQLQKCIVKSLEACPKPTSANIVDSLFNFVRKATPCKNFTPAGQDSKTKNGKAAEKSTRGAATGLAITSGTFLMGLIAAILV